MNTPTPQQTQQRPTPWSCKRRPTFVLEAARCRSCLVPLESASGKVRLKA